LREKGGDPRLKPEESGKSNCAGGE
jgi:hypothetical protein